jgi:FkbM family methyltransferase
MDLTGRVRKILLSPLRWYLRNAARPYGRVRLMSLAVRLLGDVPQLSRAQDDRRFMLQFPRDRGWEPLYFLGTYESGTADTLRRVLRAADITFDIGANIGWYTTLFAQQCPQGHCHAFEPEPGVFAELVATCALNGVEARVTLNNLGISDRPGNAMIYRFAEHPHGHSSMASAVGKDGLGVPCETTSLDRYCETHGIRRVDLIKVDVEGAELLVLKGAEALFSRKPSPMWVLEANYETSRAFGYTPPDLLRFLAERDDFRFFRVVEGWRQLLPVRHLHECAHLDNVLCVPPDRLARVAGLV